jgi:hypothetical protein
VRIFNSSAGPDQIALFYADTTVQAKVTGTAGWPDLVTVRVDTPTSFIPGDLVVAVNVDTTDGAPRAAPANDPIIARYYACVLKIDPAAGSVATTAPGDIRFVAALPWGRPGMGHCPGFSPGTTMIYRLVARGYRIDTSTPARAALGPLQQSQTGGLTDSAEDNWTDLAYGFTDLQTALQVVDLNDTDGDADGDGDAARDWYSSGAPALGGAPAKGQDLMTQNAAAGALPIPVQMTISLVARTDRDVEGITTLQTPDLHDAANPTHNQLGDRASIVLPTQPPWLTDPALQGPRIFRYTTFHVDFRNLGVGR